MIGSRKDNDHEEWHAFKSPHLPLAFGPFYWLHSVLPIGVFLSVRRSY